MMMSFTGLRELQRGGQFTASDNQFPEPEYSRGIRLLNGPGRNGSGEGF